MLACFYMLQVIFRRGRVRYAFAPFWGYFAFFIRTVPSLNFMHLVEERVFSFLFSYVSILYLFWSQYFFVYTLSIEPFVFCLSADICFFLYLLCYIPFPFLFLLFSSSREFHVHALISRTLFVCGIKNESITKLSSILP